jgi:hypothetical protein
MSLKSYRNMVRVTEIKEDTVSVVVPGWSYQENIEIKKSDIPANVLADMKVDYRYHAQLPLGADTKEEFFFNDWEMPESQEVPEMELDPTTNTYTFKRK